MRPQNVKVLIVIIDGACCDKFRKLVYNSPSKTQLLAHCPPLLCALLGIHAEFWRIEAVLGM